MSADGEIVGMVDVLKLTYATLDQVCLRLIDVENRCELTSCRSTVCQLEIARDLPGTNSGCLSTTKLSL